MTNIVSFLTAEGIDIQKVSKHLISQGILEEFNTLLHTDGAPFMKVAEAVAEIAKSESARPKCIEANLAPKLVELLSADDAALAAQACRALGNICYECDVARDTVYELDGTTNLVDILRSQLNCSDDDSKQLRIIACGFLLNLTNTHTPTQEKAIECGVCDLIIKYMESYANDADLCQMTLMCLICIADADSAKERLVDTNIAELLVQLLNSDTGLLVLDSLLELIGTLCEHDAFKLQLAKEGLCDHLLSLVAQHELSTEEEDQTILKLACDIVVLILTGDEGMEYLYKVGTGNVYKSSVAWLESSCDTLRLAGALAIGNFARNDEHCISLVRNGIMDKLLVLLKTPEDAEPDVRLQHAVLSALRNLAITAPNKPLMIENGVFDALTPVLCAETESYPVIFKLLGTLRMLVDGQVEAATRLGSEPAFIGRLVDWSEAVAHAGVKGEANRLLAALIKHSKSTNVVQCTIDEGGVPSLVSMAMSDYSVMQNEALIALSLISTLAIDSAAPVLRQATAVKTLYELLQNEEREAEILYNTLTTISAMMLSDILKDDIKDSGIGKTLDRLRIHNNESLRMKADEVWNLLKDA